MWRLALGFMLLAGLPARADIISLIAYVSQSIYLNDGVTPLPYGSIVYIYGSGDTTIDPMAPAFGGYIPGTATGDDVVLGMVRIGQPYYNDGVDDIDGTFLSDMVITWDDEEVNINHLYIRFFNTLSFTGGEVAWNESVIFTNDYDFFVVEQDFIGGYLANRTNTFTFVPEPSTIHLVLLSAGLLAGMGASMKKKSKAAPPARGPAKEAGTS
ncbi:MAG: hypothetical protein KA248_10530 [Kiritimatiellae bacterium]|nr:hypothetical protein [Kiritimatiellia bacterium]